MITKVIFVALCTMPCAIPAPVPTPAPTALVVPSFDCKGNSTAGFTGWFGDGLCDDGTLTDVDFGIHTHSGTSTT